MTEFSIFGPLLVRLVLAALCGTVLGLERTIAGKHAGVRTYALVALGSALFVIISELEIARYLGQAAGLTLDPLRIASQVVVGIGFLGAGLIIFRESKISGLTTAAGLWVTAAVGVAAGFGLLALALVATVLTLFIFTFLWLFEKRIKPERHED